jgi:hypothetical protein
MKLSDLLSSPSQKALLIEAIKAAQDLIDGRYLAPSEVAEDTGLPQARCEQIVRALQILRAIDAS